jgi:hypothetical protein
VEYTKSIILVGDDYIKAMEEKVAQKDLVEKKKELKKRGGTHKKNESIGQNFEGGGKTTTTCRCHGTMCICTKVVRQGSSSGWKRLSSTNQFRRSTSTMSICWKTSDILPRNLP